MAERDAFGHVAAMPTNIRLSDFGPRLSEYARMWEKYRAAGVIEALDPDDKENVLDSDWARDHYFAVGRDALRIIVSNLIAGSKAPPSTILDFPCGSGRVTRHLRAFFPDAVIGACDLYSQHVEFCTRQFAARPIMSKEDLSQLEAGQWDLIFCGSLLTHLPQRLFWPTMDFMIRSLTPGGIAVVTLEGRRALFLQNNRFKLIADEQFAVAHEGYLGTGFGYADYDPAFLTDKFSAQESYGVALVRPDWLTAGLAERDQITILSYSEGAWDDHQDVVVFEKRPVGFE